MKAATKKWTIIILANLENDSFLYIDKLYADIKKGIQDYFGDSIRTAALKNHVNFILLADKLRVTVDSRLPQGYRKYKADQYRFVDIYSITPDSNDDYHKEEPVYSEKYFRRDNLYKAENLEFFLRYIKKRFPARRYGFIYKSHGGNNTDIFGRFVESLLFQVTPDIKSVVVKALNKKDPDGHIEEIIREIWKKSHYAKYWSFQDPYLVEGDSKNPKVILATYKGKVKNEDDFELKYKSLADSLRKVFGQRGISFLLFDCCWGLRYEMAGLFWDVSKYIVGSVDESPLVGIGYDIWTSKLLKFPTMRDEEIAKMLVVQFYVSRFNDYMDYSLKDPSKGNFYKYGVSMTCLDMKKYQQTSVLFSALVDSLIFLLKDSTPEVSLYMTRAICESRKKCEDYTYTLPADAYPVFNIDLIWLLTNLIHQIEAVLRKHPGNQFSGIIQDIISYCKKIIIEVKLNLIVGICQNNYKTPVLTNKLAYLGGYGISITFPQTAELMKQEGSNLKDFKHFPEYEITRWTEFLELYFKKVKKFGLVTV